MWAVTFNSGGDWLATGDSAGNVRIWDIYSGKRLMSLAAHLERVHGVEFSPDGHKLATCSTDRTARIWNIHTGETTALFTHEYDVRAVAWSPDGRMLATASTPTQIWDTDTGTRLLRAATRSLEVRGDCGV